MSPPSHIHSTLLLLTTGPQVNTSTKPSESYSTTGHHVTTSPYILFPTTTHYRSTGQHVAKTLRIIPALQVTMSPSRIISYTLLTLLPTTCLHVNTSSKPSDSKDYHRLPCHHLATSILLYYYLLQVHRSTRRQNPQNHTSTTGQHVPTSPYISFSTTTFYRSRGQHVVKTSETFHYYRSPCHHLAIYLLLYYYLLQVYRSTRRQNLRNIPLLQVTMSPPHHVILHYYLTQVYRSTRRQNSQKHTSTTGLHVTTSP